jgi:hypothetical protein
MLAVRQPTNFSNLDFRFAIEDSLCGVYNLEAQIHRFKSPIANLESVILS